MNNDEQETLIKMAEKQFQKIKASKSLEDKTMAFRLMNDLLETYLDAIKAVQNSTTITRAERQKLWDEVIKKA